MPVGVIVTSNNAAAIATPVSLPVVVLGGQPSGAVVANPCVKPDVVAVPTEQGPMGPQGEPGTQGLGFGWANQSDGQFTATTPLTIATGVEAQITVDGLGPLSDSSHLRAPFAGWPFWVDNRFRPLTLYDAYVFRLEFYAASLAVGNSLRFRMDIGGTVGTFYEDRKAFATMAGEARLFTFAFPFFAKDTFVANGAGLYVTPSTAPMSLWGASIEIQPQSAGS